jgi:hypothetical protein
MKITAIIWLKDVVMANKKKRDSLPEHFNSVEEAAEFWDTHDLGDYWDLTRETYFEVDLQRRVFLTALEPELARKLGEYAHKQGISSQTLINLWLSEKLAEAQAKRDKVAE